MGGNHKAGEIQGQTRQHSRLINLLGVKQICVGINKMDCDTAGYKQARYDEIMNEMKSTLIKVGWKKDFVEKNTPLVPISGWMGDNLIKKTTWTGGKVWMFLSIRRPFTLTHCSTASTTSFVCHSAPQVLQCGCQSQVFTRSRVLVMFSQAGWSRASSSLVRT